ncbi:MAG: helix-turn-helix transcriptional regulator [Lachnospiraceae bacterium]|nr:helix-turn-helix transcriptional regulator [Lachnospiraceae bacterium]
MFKEEFMYPELLHARSYRSIDYSIIDYPEREAEFFEISIYIEDNGTLYLNGTEHRIQRGDVRFTRPGDILRTDIPFHALSVVLRFGQDNTAYNHNFIDRIPSFFHCNEETIHMFESIIRLNSSMSTGDKILMNAHILQLLHHLYTFINQTRPIPQAVQICLDYMKAHYDQAITLSTLGELTGYAPLHVHRLFKEHVGQTPCEYLQILRMLQARNLLDTTTLSVCEITNAVGFRSLSSFQALFKKSFGISPGKYRKRSEI